MSNAKKKEGNLGTKSKSNGNPAYTKIEPCTLIEPATPVNHLNNNNEAHTKVL